MTFGKLLAAKLKQSNKVRYQVIVKTIKPDEYQATVLDYLKLVHPDNLIPSRSAKREPPLVLRALCQGPFRWTILNASVRYLLLQMLIQEKCLT